MLQRSSSFPFADFAFIENQLDRLAQEALGLRSQTSVTTLPVDVYDTGEDVVIQAFVPGMRAEHLDINIEDGVVTISGQFPQLYDREDAQTWSWYARELRGGRFQRSLSLPYKVDVDQASATVSDGILHLSLPKAPEAKPRKIAISNSAAATHTPELTATT